MIYDGLFHVSFSAKYPAIQCTGIKLPYAKPLTDSGTEWYCRPIKDGVDGNIFQ